MAWARRSREEKETYFPNYAVTRRQKRYIANKRMEEEGMTKFRKKYYEVEKRGPVILRHQLPTKFAEQWREKWQEEQ